MDFIRTWIRNLFIDVLVFIGVCIFMLIFAKIFYPDAISFLILTGQMSVQFASVLKLWPIIILAVIISTIPRRIRKKKGNTNTQPR